MLGMNILLEFDGISLNVIQLNKNIYVKVFIDMMNKYFGLWSFNGSDTYWIIVIAFAYRSVDG